MLFPMNDVFQKIIDRALPAEIVYEDEHTLAFLDAHPVHPGHTLVVPKKFARNLLDIDHDSYTAVMETVRTLAPVVRDAVEAEGINVHINNEPAAGQVVFHFHVHIIPRYSDDGFTHWHGKRPYKDGEAAVVAEKIREHLT